VSKPNQQIAIAGGGFTGLFTALCLRYHYYEGQIILIDQSDRFVFKPLLYELLNGQMDVDQVCPTYQELLRGSGVVFVQDIVQHIDLAGHEIRLASGLHYTYTNLVLALGSITGYFGTPGAAENSFSFRTREDALALRHQLRHCLQCATQTQDQQLRQKLLTFALIGAGPAGVELASTLADWLPDWYAQLGGNPQEIRVVLINRGSQILSGDTNEHLRETALEALQQRAIPVELLTNAPVTALQPSKVEYMHNGQPAMLEAKTIVWTAGTATHPLMKTLSIPEEHRDRHARPLITPTLQLMDYPEVFAGGDCATQQKPEPALAQVAYQQAKVIAHNIIAISAGEAPQVGRVLLRGTLMKLGTQEGVAEIFNQYEVKGRLGYMVRQLTYLQMLPTPVHNLKITAEWLTEEILHHAKTLV
jgi:NADH dehydrogenase